jgi:hypothetical protein
MCSLLVSQICLSLSKYQFSSSDDDDDDDESIGGSNAFVCLSCNVNK